MLKIKDNVDLKELEKFGFIKQHWGYKYYPNKNSANTKYFSNMKIYNNRIEFCLENMSSWCNSLEELEEDFDNIQKSCEDFKRKINDLIQAGIVEKI